MQKEEEVKPSDASLEAKRIAETLLVPHMVKTITEHFQSKPNTPIGFVMCHHPHCDSLAHLCHSSIYNPTIKRTIDCFLQDTRFHFFDGRRFVERVKLLHRALREAIKTSLKQHKPFRPYSMHTFKQVHCILKDEEEQVEFMDDFMWSNDCWENEKNWRSSHRRWQVDEDGEDGYETSESHDCDDTEECQSKLLLVFRLMQSKEDRKLDRDQKEELAETAILAKPIPTTATRPVVNGPIPILSSQLERLVPLVRAAAHKVVRVPDNAASFVVDKNHLENTTPVRIVALDVLPCSMYGQVKPGSLVKRSSTKLPLP